MLGGTAWLGREIAARAVAGGADVTCVARGTSGAAPQGARFVALDRAAPGAFSDPSAAAALAGEWDEVVEIAWDPAVTDPTLAALADRAAHWTLVSTISVYADEATPGQDESAALVAPLDDGVPASPEAYGAAKVSVERSAGARLGDRLLVVRPGLIVGPGDGSGRFGYWPARFARGGRVLAPDPTDRVVQVIDVADLAAYVVDAGATGLGGAVNAVGESTPLARVLSACATAVAFNGELVERGDEWLAARGVNPWSGPRSLPLWLPAGHRGMMSRSNARYRETGGVLRPLEDTIGRVLADERERGIDRDRPAGLTAEEERALLA